MNTSMRLPIHQNRRNSWYCRTFSCEMMSVRLLFLLAAGGRKKVGLERAHASPGGAPFGPKICGFAWLSMISIKVVAFYLEVLDYIDGQ